MVCGVIVEMAKNAFCNSHAVDSYFFPFPSDIRTKLSFIFAQIVVVEIASVLWVVTTAVALSSQCPDPCKGSTEDWGWDDT